MSNDTDDVVPFERNLGFFDAPQLIQCRTCRALKKANNANFRNIRGKVDRFRFKCRNCERETTYARTVDAKLVAIRNRPGLTDAEREALILGDGTPLHPGVREQVSSERKARLRKARIVTHRDTCTQAWAEVRKLIAARRLELDMRVRASRHYVAKAGASQGIAYCMSAHPQVEGYIRLVLATYSSIVARMRKANDWREAMHNRLPPKHWIDAIGKGREGWMEVSPFEFTTPEEREALRLADPAKVGGPCAADWSFMVADSGRKNATMQYHVYPLWLANGKTIAQMSPDWLKTFNKAGDGDA